MRPHRLRRRPRFLGFLAVAFLGASLLVMLLWNALMPDLFGLPAIHFLQAAGLLLLCRLLFGGGPWGKGPRSGRRWRGRLRRKWAAMSPEERKAFREKMRGWRCGPWEADKEETTESGDPDELV